MPDTWELQAERRRTEREPRDWATMRAALIESGMVEERARAREAIVGPIASKDCVVQSDRGAVSLVDTLWLEEHGE